MNHHRIVISTEAWWFYRHAQWRDLQFACASYSAGTNSLQVLTQSAPQTFASCSATCRSLRCGGKTRRLRSRWHGMGEI